MSTPVSLSQASAHKCICGSSPFPAKGRQPLSAPHRLTFLAAPPSRPSLHFRSPAQRNSGPPYYLFPSLSSIRVRAPAPPRASGILLAELAAAADVSPYAVAAGLLGPFLSAANFLFIIRIVMSWYPQLPVNSFPYVIAYAPTEPLLAPTRQLIPPVGGVDVSPVIWVAILSFLNETLVGQQGILVLLSQSQV